MNSAPPTLIVFAGLPGAGKTTLATALARRLTASYLRIDVIEQALRASGELAADIGPAGYVVAGALAESNLNAGLSVGADAVNPVAESRAGWRDVAAATKARLVEIEVVCSDAAEHRRRVETRAPDLPGLRLPTWAEVTGRGYEPWDVPRIVVDTARRSAEEAFAELLARIGPHADC